MNNVEKFDYLKKRIDSESIGIVVTQIDPDALGSAFGLQYLLKTLGIPSEIYYVGTVSHPQNRAIANYFNLLNKMKKIDTLDPESYYCLVDSHEYDDSRLATHLNPKRLLMVIDHHRCDKHKLTEDCLDGEQELMIIVDEIGSASTLVAELFQELEVQYEDDAKSIFNLLALGIYTDTKNLVSATERDNKAFTFLRNYLDPIDISRFVDYTLPGNFFKNMLSAMGTFTQEGPRSMASLGFIARKDRDNLSTIADLLLRREGVDFVAVWAIVEDTVSLSFRNSNLSTPLDDFVKEQFQGKGGAKLTSTGIGEGGATIPLGMEFWFGEENKDSILETVSNKLKQLIFKE